jgi:hypothetical protein
MKARKDLAHADVLTLSRDELATIFRTVRSGMGAGAR